MRGCQNLAAIELVIEPQHVSVAEFLMGHKEVEKLIGVRISEIKQG